MKQQFLVSFMLFAFPFSIAEGSSGGLGKKHNLIPEEGNLKQWAQSIKDEITIYHVKAPQEQVLHAISHWIDEWLSEQAVIESSLPDNVDILKQHFWQSLTPKIDSLLKNLVEAGSIEQDYVDSLRNQLRMARLEYQTKMVRFTDSIVDADPRNFVNPDNNIASGLYKAIIRQWCEVAKAGLQLSLGDTTNMTNSDLFIKKTSTWLEDWSKVVVELMPGNNGDGWKQHFFQTIRPLVADFFRQQIYPTNWEENHVKWREDQVIETVQFLEAMAMDVKKLQAFMEVALELVAKSKVDVVNKKEPVAQSITHTEEL